MKIKIILFIILVFASCLRLLNLSNFPAGFNADEAAIGYNAYSLINTGKDEYGESFPLVFKSFGDYKPGLYFYIVMPFVAILGLNEFTVRLPSALFGISTVFLIYMLAKRVFDYKVGLVSAFFLAITPWHVHFSRGGWESNVATYLITLGVYLFILGLNSVKFLFFSMIAFLLSMYVYQSPRLVVPALLLLLFVFYKSQIIEQVKNIKISIVYIVILVLLSLPVLFQFFNGSGSARFAGLSFLSDKGPVMRLNELRGQHADQFSPFFHNKLLLYPVVFLGHYLDHFKSDFLFINGEEVIRNKVPEVGQLYLVMALFLIAGFLFLINNNSNLKIIILLWILVAPIASSTTFQTPNALRSLNMVVPLIIIIAFGAVKLYTQLFKNIRLFVFAPLVFLTIFETFHYLESYYNHYPKRYSKAWEYGFKEMVAKLNRYEAQYNKVVITDRYDQPYILLLFYKSSLPSKDGKKYDPAKYQPQAKLSERDKFNFGTVKSFDKYEFRSFTIDEILQSQNTLFIGTPNELDEKDILDKVVFPSGESAFIFKSKP